MEEKLLHDLAQAGWCREEEARGCWGCQEDLHRPGSLLQTCIHPSDESYPTVVVSVSWPSAPVSPSSFAPYSPASCPAPGHQEENPDHHWTQPLSLSMTLSPWYNYVTLCISIWCVHTNCWYTTDSARTAINRLLLADPCRPVSPSLILASHWSTVANTGCDWWRGQLPCKQSRISWYVWWRVRCERRVNYGDTGMVASHGPVKNYFSSSFIFT